MLEVLPDRFVDHPLRCMHGCGFPLQGRAGVSKCAGAHQPRCVEKLQLVQELSLMLLRGADLWRRHPSPLQPVTSALSLLFFVPMHQPYARDVLDGRRTIARDVARHGPSPDFAGGRSARKRGLHVSSWSPGGDSHRGHALPRCRRRHATGSRRGRRTSRSTRGRLDVT